MKEMDAEQELANWFSTYGLLTAKRILGLFKVNLSNKELIIAIKTPSSIYYQLIQVPLKNIFNGIILQQVQDYQVYIQKLFVDYLLSGEAEKSEDSPGGQIREDIKSEHEKLLQMNKDISELELDHQQFIAESQQKLMEWASNLQKKPQAVPQEIKQMLELSTELNIKICSLRSQLYDLILRSVEFFSLLPDYKIDPIKNEKNQSSIIFDSKIGEK